MSGCLTELLLFSHSLFCYSFRPFTYLFRITEKIVFDKSQPVVEFKNVRNCCRQVQVGNVCIGYFLEMLDDSTQAVAMGNYQQVILTCQCGKDDAFPIRHYTLNGIFQGFRTWKFHIRDICITYVFTRIARIVLSQCCWSYIITSPPGVYLFFTILGSRLTFVKSLKYAVMFLIQPPCLFDGNPALIQAVQNVVQRFYSTF